MPLRSPVLGRMRARSFSSNNITGNNSTQSSPGLDFVGSPAVTPNITPVVGDQVPKAYVTHFPFDMSDLHTKLQQLYIYKDSTINTLPPAAKENYLYINNLVRVLYGSEEYTTFYNIVQNVFSKDSSAIQQGTLGAYFRGCALTTSMDPSGCSILCAGALPAPDSGDQAASCQYPVLIAIWSTDHYSWVVLHNLDNKDHAIIFVTEEFRGFSIAEKKELQENLHVKFATVYQTSSIGESYTPLTKDFQPVDDLFLRNVSTAPPENQSSSTSTTPPNTLSSTSGNSMMSSGSIIAISVIIVIVVFLLVIVLFENFTNVLPKMYYD